MFRYAPNRSSDWNYEHAPDEQAFEGRRPLDAPVPGRDWDFCGLPVSSPLGMPAGPLLNGRWVLRYAHAGFDVLTYKTVRSRARECYPLPNLQPVAAAEQPEYAEIFNANVEKLNARLFSYLDYAIVGGR